MEPLPVVVPASNVPPPLLSVTGVARVVNVVGIMPPVTRPTTSLNEATASRYIAPCPAANDCPAAEPEPVKPFEETVTVHDASNAPRVSVTVVACSGPETDVPSTLLVALPRSTSALLGTDSDKPEEAPMLNVTFVELEQLLLQPPAASAGDALTALRARVLAPTTAARSLRWVMPLPFAS